jgi:hypothetical protein
MWLSNCFKIPKLSLRDFILKFIVLVCVSCNFSVAQTKIGFKSFSDLTTDGAFVSILKNKPFYFLPGNAPSDANKSYCLNILCDSNFDTLRTIKSNTINNAYGSYLTLVPFTNKINKLYYWGVATNYSTSTSTQNMVFGNANQSDYTLINHKTYYSKYYHIGKYINTFLNDTTFVSVHNFKWYHPSSLPYGTSIWWFNKNLDTIQQKVYFEASGNTDLTPLSVYPLLNKDILISGFTDTLNVNNSDAFLMRLDSAGNVKYARSIGTSGHDILFLNKVGNDFYFVGTSSLSYTSHPNSDIYLTKIDIATGNTAKTYKILHDSIGITAMQDLSVQESKIYLPCNTYSHAIPPYKLKSCYFLIDTNGIISKQYIHSQASNGYWNSYTLPIVTDSLKNMFGSVVKYNYPGDPHYTSLFKLDSNLVGCYPSDAPFSFTTTVATGALHSLPMNIVTAKDSIFDVTTPGAILQGHGFNTIVDECSGYVGINEHELGNEHFKIYPNPSVGVFYYEFNADENNNQDATLTVLNMLGEVIVTGTINTNNPKGMIDLSTMPNGIYFISIYNARKQLFNSKLSVVK